jgi:RNA recognition motif-containing protein
MKAIKLHKPKFNKNKPSRDASQFMATKKPSSNKKNDDKQTTGFYQRHNGTTTIYVGNLRFTRDEKDIKSMFATYGVVNFVNVVLDRETKKSKGFAFVQMPNSKSASFAIEKLNGKIIDGRTLKVSIASERDPENSVSTKKPFQTKKMREDTESGIEKAAPKMPTRRRDKKPNLKTLFKYLDQ